MPEIWITESNQSLESWGGINDWRGCRGRLDQSRTCGSVVRVARTRLVIALRNEFKNSAHGN